MPTIELENKIASQAVRGQNVKLTVDLSSQSSEFNQLEVGQICSFSGGKSAIIYSIDTYGNTFEISPIQPNFDLSTNESGYFQKDISVTVTL